MVGFLKAFKVRLGGLTMSHHPPETADDWKYVAKAHAFMRDSWREEFLKAALKHERFKRIVWKLFDLILADDH